MYLYKYVICERRMTKKCSTNHWTRTECNSWTHAILLLFCFAYPVHADIIRHQRAYVRSVHSGKQSFLLIWQPAQEPQMKKIIIKKLCQKKFMNQHRYLYCFSTRLKQLARGKGSERVIAVFFWKDGWFYLDIKFWWNIVLLM